MAEWRPLRRTWLNGLLPCPFLAWHDDSNCRLPCFGVCVGSCPPAPGQNCWPSFGCSCLFWRMTAAFSHWPSTLQSFLLLFQSFLLLFQSYLSRFQSYQSFLPVISVMSVMSAISACHFCLVCHIRHGFCHFCLSFPSCLSYPPSSLSFPPTCLLLCVVSACGIHRFLCVHLCFLSVRCLLNLSAIHLHRWAGGSGGGRTQLLR